MSLVFFFHEFLLRFIQSIWGWLTRKNFYILYSFYGARKWCSFGDRGCEWGGLGRAHRQSSSKISVPVFCLNEFYASLYLNSAFIVVYLHQNLEFVWYGSAVCSFFMVLWCWFCSFLESEMCCQIATSLKSFWM